MPTKSKATQSRRQTKFRDDLASIEDRSALPRVEIQWTKRELASLAVLVASPHAPKPTSALIRAVRG